MGRGDGRAGSRARGLAPSSALSLPTLPVPPPPHHARAHKHNPPKKAWLTDQARLLVAAERELLFALNFDLVVDVPHSVRVGWWWGWVGWLGGWEV